MNFTYLIPFLFWSLLAVVAVLFAIVTAFLGFAIRLDVKLIYFARRSYYQLRGFRVLTHSCLPYANRYVYE